MKWISTIADASTAAISIFVGGVILAMCVAVSVV